MKTIDLAAERDEMVEQQIEARGVRDQRVLDAMRTVPREEFLLEKLRESAYLDTPLPIAADHTISQPYIVAFMIEALALEGGERDEATWLVDDVYHVLGRERGKCRLDCRPSTRCLSVLNSSTASSTPTDRTMNSIEKRSRTSWHARHTFPACCSRVTSPRVPKKAGLSDVCPPFDRNDSGVGQGGRMK